MSLILHASDLRFGVGDKDFLDEIARHGLDLVVFSGDFTQNGRKQEFMAARDFLKSITVPVLCVPGDRDLPRFNIWQRFTDPMKLYRDYIHPMPETVHEDDHSFIVGLNTTNPMLWLDGIVSERQVIFTLHQYRQAPHDKVRIFACHHPMTALKNSDQLLKVLNDQYVDLVLTGQDNILFENGPIFAGVGKGAYNLIRLSPDMVEIEQVTLGPNTVTQTLKIPRRIVPDEGGL